MSFPNTRHSLIQRISISATEDDWRQFLADYWRPLCRFAARWGKLNIDDAEDVAAATIEVVIRNELLSRWVSNRKAKLRTLLCSVARKVLSNRVRIVEGRSRRLRDHGGALDAIVADDAAGTLEAPPEQVDAFYEAWAEELLQSAIESLLTDYYRVGRGDGFRVLYGRICENMSMPEISQSLQITVATAENHYKHARKQLEARLEQLLRRHVQRYSSPADVEDEFRHEWGRLGEFLKTRGGLDEALRRSYQDFDATELRKREAASMTAIISNVGRYLKKSRKTEPSTPFRSRNFRRLANSLKIGLSSA